MADKNKQRESQNSDSQNDNSEQEEDNSQLNQREEFFSEIRSEKGNKQKESNQEEPDYGFEADIED